MPPSGRRGTQEPACDIVIQPRAGRVPLLSGETSQRIAVNLNAQPRSGGDRE